MGGLGGKKKKGGVTKGGKNTRGRVFIKFEKKVGTQKIDVILFFLISKF